MSEVIETVGWLIFAIWAAVLLPSAVTMSCRTLRRHSARLPELEPRPLVSVIVPARDEGKKIERTLRSLLASEGVHLEVIAVDDRSQDETGAVMDRMAETDARLRVFHVTKLPEGWLGKNHALHVGAQSARGEYLLLTDGDVIFAPQAIGLSVRYAVGRKIDHLCLMPRMVRGGYWENALVTYFGVMFAAGTFCWLVPTPCKRAYVGVGAFNLVRAEAYRQTGGHQPIRLDVLDDVKLGKLMKRTGFRQDLLSADDLVQVRWQESAWSVIRGLEKNAFASVDYSLAKLAILSLAGLALLLPPYAAAWLWPDGRSLGFVASLLLMHIVYAVLGHRLGGGWMVCPVLPLAALGMLFAFWRSAWITLRQGGVRWRETFYPLETLRRNLFR